MHDSPTADASAHHSLWRPPNRRDFFRRHGCFHHRRTRTRLRRDASGAALLREQGLLSPQRDGLNRLYSPRDRSRLSLILKGKKLGFTLAEIQQMIAAEEGGQANPATLNLSQEKVLEQIELLQRQKAELDEGLAELSRIYTALAGKPLDRTGS